MQSLASPIHHGQHIEYASWHRFGIPTTVYNQHTPIINANEFHGQSASGSARESLRLNPQAPPFIPRSKQTIKQGVGVNKYLSLRGSKVVRTSENYHDFGSLIGETQDVRRHLPKPSTSAHRQVPRDTSGVYLEQNYKIEQESEPILSENERWTAGLEQRSLHHGSATALNSANPNVRAKNSEQREFSSFSHSVTPVPREKLHPKLSKLYTRIGNYKVIKQRANELRGDFYADGFARERQRAVDNDPSISDSQRLNAHFLELRKITDELGIIKNDIYRMIREARADGLEPSYLEHIEDSSNSNSSDSDSVQGDVEASTDTTYVQCDQTPLLIPLSIVPKVLPTARSPESAALHTFLNSIPGRRVAKLAPTAYAAGSAELHYGAEHIPEHVNTAANPTTDVLETRVVHGFLRIPPGSSPRIYTTTNLLSEWTDKRDRINRWILDTLCEDRLEQLKAKAHVDFIWALPEKAWLEHLLRSWDSDGMAFGLALSDRFVPSEEVSDDYSMPTRVHASTKPLVGVSLNSHVASEQIKGRSELDSSSATETTTVSTAVKTSSDVVIEFVSHVIQGTVYELEVVQILEGSRHLENRTTVVLTAQHMLYS